MNAVTHLRLHASNEKDLGFGFMDDQYFDWAIKFFREWEAEQTSEKQLK
jgi:hypothetical protein